MGDVISLDAVRAAKAHLDLVRRDADAASGFYASAVPAAPAQPVLPGPTAAEMQRRAREEQLENTKWMARQLREGRRVAPGTDDRRH